MPPVQLPEDEDLVDTSVEPIRFLTAIHQIANSKAVSGDAIKYLLAAIHVKQNRTSTDENNLSSRKGKAASLLNGLSNLARASGDFETIRILLGWDFDTFDPEHTTPKKRQATDDGSVVEVKRNRKPVNDELNTIDENSHGALEVFDDNDNNQSSTSGVSEIVDPMIDYDISPSDRVENQPQSVQNKERNSQASTSGKINQSHVNTPSKGPSISCALCDSSLSSTVGLDIHYRETHKVMDPEQILFYNGTPLFTRPSSNINTDGGKAAWFETQKNQAIAKYIDLKFNCRLCDIKLDDNEILVQHYINKGSIGGHRVDKSKVRTMNKLFKFKTGANLESLPTSNPRKVRKPRNTGTRKDQSESPESENVSTRELSKRVEDIVRASHSRISVDADKLHDRPVTTQVGIHPTLNDQHRSISMDSVDLSNDDDLYAYDAPNTVHVDNATNTYVRNLKKELKIEEDCNVRVSSPYHVEYDLNDNN